MTFYQELQLNQAGSKLMIQEAVGRRAKAWHLLVYLVKILLTMVFCVAFVTLYGWVTKGRRTTLWAWWFCSA